MGAQLAAGLAGRRRFLLGMAVPLGLALAGHGNRALAARSLEAGGHSAAAGGARGAPPLLETGGRQAAAGAGERRIALHHLYTGESLKAVFWAEGDWHREGLLAIDHLLRDWRVDATTVIDPPLIGLLWALQQGLGSSGPILVHSGYRTAATNALLRRRRRGVARNSLHMKGMAVDLEVPGRSLGQIRRVAMALGRGGVGYYPRSGFVHLDTGPVRSW